MTCITSPRFAVTWWKLLDFQEKISARSRSWLSSTIYLRVVPRTCLGGASSPSSRASLCLLVRSLFLTFFFSALTLACTSRRLHRFLIRETSFFTMTCRGKNERQH